MKNITRKLAALSIIVTGAIAIAPNHVQAQSTLGWQDNTTNFVPVGDGESPIDESFSVTFNTEPVNVNVSTGIFDNFFPSTPILVNVPTTTSGFTFDSSVSATASIYTNDSSLVFDFSDVEPGLTATLPAGAQFEVIQDSDGAVEIDLLGGANSASEWRFAIPGIGNVTAQDSVLEFGDLVGNAGGTYTAEAEVPEPMTILGSFAVLGFGTVLKRQKNKKMSN